MNLPLIFLVLNSVILPINREKGQTIEYQQRYSVPVQYHAGQRQTVLLVEDPGYWVFGPANKPDSLWHGVLSRIFGENQFGWFGPILDPNQDGPNLAIMQDYQLVIWNTYDYWWGAPQGFKPGLTFQDQINLQDYLAGGGKVWLIGQDLILSGVSTEWLAQYFHLADQTPDYWHGPSLIVRDSINASPLSLRLQADYQTNVFWPDALVADSQGVIALKDQDHEQTIGIAAPILSPFITAFWTIDGRHPETIDNWEYLVRKMLIGFGLPVTIVDAGIETIDLPSTILENTLWPPRAVVKNYGTVTQLIPVACRIEPGGFYSRVSLTLPPDSAQLVLFPDTFHFSRGFYQVTVYTDLDDDIDRRNDTVAVVIEATNWRYYDDGQPFNAWAWNEENNGWGVQFPVSVDCRVDSIAVFIADTTWPVPGGDTATIRLYSGAQRPESLRVEINHIPVNRGCWNFFAVDTSNTDYHPGDNIYVFYVQVGDLPQCPGLVFDPHINNYPYMWQLYHDSFSVALPGGDWLIRCHVRPYFEIQEDARPAFRSGVLKAPTIFQPGARLGFTLEQPAMVSINLYDAVGQRQKIINSGFYSAGQHFIPLILEVPSGVYFIVLKTNIGTSATQKIIIIN